MILAFDTYYFEDKAKTVCVLFEHWQDAVPLQIYDEVLTGIEPYQSGLFYKRELPCILSLLHRVKAQIQQTITAIVIDGFVFLDDQGKLGLGAHLYHHLEQLGQAVPVIGVAKSGFYDNTKNVLELLRGKSKKPLYITAIEMDIQRAFECVQEMHGAYRMPTLLQVLDIETRA